MTADNGSQEIHAGRLFVASCFALIATAVAFATVGAIMNSLKATFILSNEQVGWIGGAALWGFTISIVIFGPLVDALGMKNLMRMAFFGHAVGVLIMVLANGFAMLFVGALIVALANGTVEAVCNPLVATLFPDKKTEMLNKFHVWFPGGIVIGGLIAFLIGQTGIAAATGAWQIKLAVILVPTVIYGYLFLGQAFPVTERLQSGVTFGQMFKETFSRPLFIILAVCMMMTASIELGPNRWVPAVLEAGGIAGILVLVWINGLMAIMRYYAGPVVKRIAPTGLLLLSAIVSGIGLYWLSYTEGFAMAILAGTVFAVGICYFWPTMLGMTSERVPKGGALALGMMGGIGMAVVGLVTSPMMGRVADNYLHDELHYQETTSVLAQVTDTYPALKARISGDAADDVQAAIDAAQGVLNKAAVGSLPKFETANALRSAISVAPMSAAAGAAREVLGPAENHGGKISFRRVAPLAIILVIIFGVLYIRDRKIGGYKVEQIA